SRSSMRPEWTKRRGCPAVHTDRRCNGDRARVTRRGPTSRGGEADEWRWTAPGRCAAGACEAPLPGQRRRGSYHHHTNRVGRILAELNPFGRRVAPDRGPRALRDDPRMSFVLTRDPEEFMARAGSLVMSRLECNVMATVLVNLREGAFGEGKALFGYSLAPDGNPVGAAMRVMPYPLLTSSVAESEVASLTELWLTEDPAIPGVVGIPATARAIAAEWARASGGVTRIRMRQAMHELTEVVDPVHRPPGALRPAALGER